MRESESENVDLYTTPIFLAIPFLVVMLLSLMIPSKRSGSRRIARYYSSPLVKLTYLISIVLLVGGAVFAGLFLLGNDAFSPLYYISNIGLYSLAGIGLVIQNMLGVRLSRRTAISGAGGSPDVTFAKVRDEQPREAQYMEVEPVEDDD